MYQQVSGSQAQQVAASSSALLPLVLQSLSSDHNEEEQVICSLESEGFLASVLVLVPGDPGLRWMGWLVGSRWCAGGRLEETGGQEWAGGVQVGSQLLARPTS